MKKISARARKALLPALLVVVMGVGGVWLLRKITPVFIDFPNEGKVEALEFSPDGKRLVTFYRDYKLNQRFGEIYDSQTGKKLLTLADSPIFASSNSPAGNEMLSYGWPSWSPDGTRIVANYRDGTRSTVKRPIFGVSPASSKKASVEFLPLNKFAFWNAQTGDVQAKHLYTSPNESSFVDKVQFSRDGTTLIGNGSPPLLFDARTGQKRDVLKGNLGPAYRGKYHEQLKLVAGTSNDDEHFEVFDAATRKTIWKPHTGSVFDFWWHRDILGVIDWGDPRPGRRKGKDRVLLWDARTRSALQSPPSSASTLTFNPNSNAVALLGSRLDPSLPKNSVLNRQLVIWDYRRNRVMWRYYKNSLLEWAQWSPNGKWLSVFSIYRNGTPSQMLIFEQNGKLHYQFETSDSMSRWSPDSTYIVLVDQKSDIFDRTLRPQRLRFIRIDE